MLKLLLSGVLLPAALSTAGASGSPEETGQRPVVPKPGTRQPDACSSHTVTRFVGANATISVRNAIIAALGHDQIRWIRPGTAVTQDFRADRLNVILDEAGRILTMRCG